MQIVRGKKLEKAADGEFLKLAQESSRVVVDVGTGDARASYRIAKENPDWLVVGVDPAWQRMTQTSIRSRRKPAKGGVPNLLLVNSSIESAPEELAGAADELLVLMPWGKLLHGLVRGDEDIWTGLRTVAKPGAPLTATVGTSIWREPVPRDIQGLPELTHAYVEEVLTAKVAASGWRITDFRLTGAQDADAVSSSWARRLDAASTEVIATLTAVTAGPEE
ncbi:class I SAM-dependent methyltransferase [Streptomyces sp. OfavH-34-F]|uniref:class I SAM-dependent methyltransferase n=1 Tax=unclassified Streptomyces TaxID=2593676 RepID=UPI001EF2FDB9|nr:class I SAM-dependent methyltransferase [Streptomyces sp. OfavH-34-F]MCG7527646.1 class I SAM-dependent methyltransferase [Streptomyces sp. OfavH-34-F]